MNITRNSSAASPVLPQATHEERELIKLNAAYIHTLCTACKWLSYPALLHIYNIRSHIAPICGTSHYLNVFSICIKINLANRE